MGQKPMVICRQPTLHAGLHDIAAGNAWPKRLESGMKTIEKWPGHQPPSAKAQLVSFDFVHLTNLFAQQPSP